MQKRYEAYAKSDDFIRRYIFPGGHLPTISALVSSITAGSSQSSHARNGLIVSSIEDIGPHYAKTLRLWREAFLHNFEAKIRPALVSDGKCKTKEDLEMFERKWEYYFSYCEAGFATKTLGDVIVTVAREGAMEVMEDIPL